MPDQEFVQWLATMGVGGAIAGLVFMFYRKDVKQFTELWKNQSELLIIVVKENTTSNVTLVEMVRALHQRLDRDNVDREREVQARADDRDERRRH